jgi:hypothetical protein
MLASFIAGLSFQTPSNLISFIAEIFSGLTSMVLKDWQAITSIIYGASGLLLGYSFFKARVGIDSKNSEDERVRKRLLYVFDEINQSDDTADLIWNLDVKNQKELEQARRKLDKKLALMTVYLDNNDTLLKLNESELQTVVKVHSIFNSSKVLSEVNFQELRKSNRSSDQLDFSDAIQEARTICLQKIETL